MLRLVQNRLRRTGFHHLTLVHHDQLCGPFGGQRQIVGDQQHGGTQFTGELLQMIEDAALHGDVEGRRRLVSD